MKLKILILSLFIFSNLQGQDKPFKSKYISIGISPLCLIEPKTSTFESVLEIKPLDDFSIELKYGFPLGLTPSRNEIRLNDSYYEMKIGAKYWPYYSHFLGLEYFHVNHDYGKTNNFYRRNGDFISYNSANISRKVNGIRLRVGTFYDFDFGLILEAFFGLGVRNVAISYHSTTGESPLSFSPEGEWFSPKDRIVGSKNKFDYYLGAKISWSLFQF